MILIRKYGGFKDISTYQDDGSGINSIKNRIYPVGMVYVQYPGMPAPSSLFPGTWTNISSNYAGRFFRAEGGDAASFGSCQDWNVGGNDLNTSISNWRAAASSFEHQHESGMYIIGDAYTPPYGYRIESSWDGYYQAGRWEAGYMSIDICVDNTGGSNNSSYSDTDRYIYVKYDNGVETRPINRTVIIWKRTA